MSGSNRPTVPHVDGRSDTSGRVQSRATSPNPWSSRRHPRPMDPRKRPLPRPRGGSPPEKRNRIPGQANQNRAHRSQNQRSLMYPNHYQSTESVTQTASADPRLRNTSTSRTPVNVLTEPRSERALSVPSGTNPDFPESHGAGQTNLDKQDPRKQRKEHSPLHLPSPRSNGSRATTPVNTAPLAPSMVPATKDPQAGARQNTLSIAGPADRPEWTHPNGVPYSPAVVQMIEAKRQAKVAGANSAGEAYNAAAPGGISSSTTASPALQTQIKALQFDNAMLKKDRDNTLKRLQILEERLQDAAIATVASPKSRDQSTRMRELEDRIKVLEDLSPSPKISGSLEPGQVPESISDQIKAMADTISRQGKDLEKVKAGAKDTAKTTGTVLDLSKQVRSSIESSKEIIQNEVHAATQKLRDRQETNEKTIAKYDERVQKCLNFMHGMEKKRILEQLKTQDEDLRRFKQGNEHTKREAELARNKVESLDKDIRRYIGPLNEHYNSNQMTIIQSIAQMAEFVKTPQPKQSFTKYDRSGSPATLSELKQGYATLSECLVRAEKSTEDVSKLGNLQQRRLDELEATVNATAGGTAIPDLTVENLVEKEDFYAVNQAMSSNIETISVALEVTEGKVHENTEDIHALRNDVTTIFENSLDEFKAGILLKLDKLAEDLEVANSKITRVEQEATKPPVDTSHLDEYMAETKSKLGKLVAEQETIQAENTLSKQELSNLFKSIEKLQAKYVEEFQKSQDHIIAQMRGLLSAEASQRMQSIREMNECIATKADAGRIANQIEQYSMGFRSLEERYNNITTEYLHKRMVDWFVQNYAGTPAHLTAQYQSLRQEVDRLKVTSRTATPQEQQPEITMLVKNARQIEELVKSQSEPRNDPEVLVKLDEAHSNAKTALERIEQAQSASEAQASQIEPILKSVAGLQTSFHNLNATDSPFVRIQELRDLQTSWTNFQSLIKSALNTERDARIASSNELRTSAGRANDARIKAESSLRTQIDGHVKRLDGRLDEMSEDWQARGGALEATAEQLRAEFDDVNDNLIQPNREMFGMFDLAVVLLGQLQDAIEKINQKLPGKPLKLAWTAKPWDEFEQLEVPSSLEDGEVRSQEKALSKGRGKGKGKSRQ